MNEFLKKNGIYIIVFFALSSLITQCSISRNVNTLLNRVNILEDSIKHNSETIRSFNSSIQSDIEKQFIQNLLYNDALQKRTMSTQDIQKRLDNLDKKIKEKE